MRSVALHLLQESIGPQINRHINAGSNCLNLNEVFSIKLEAAPRYQLRRFAPDATLSHATLRLPSRPARLPRSRDAETLEGRLDH
jgi:hypothetical protein